MSRSRTRQALAAAHDRARAQHVVVGLDGFVDLIVTPVGLRRGQGENFTAIHSIPEFGQRVLGAAGKSTNLELYPRAEKLGGNGPIMANAALATGPSVTYIGALGHPQVHPVFADMASRAKIISLCSPAHTTAIEFNDGKLMLGTMRSLDEISYQRICAVMGANEFEAELAKADLVIGAVLIPGAKAPMLVEREDLKRMKPGSVIIDVAIDQGGCIATSKPTTHSNPTYMVDDVVHYCVANMPGAVGRTSTFALCNVTLPWVLAIIVAEELLWRGALLETFARRVSPPAAMALSVATYCVAQAGTGSWIVTLLALVCGTLWTLQRRLTRSLLSPLIAHLIWTPTVILLLPVNTPP